MTRPSDSEGAVGAPAVTPTIADTFPPRADPPARPSPLARVRQIGLCVFAVELLAFGAYSTIAWNRYSLTNDFWLLDAPITKITHSGFTTSVRTMEDHFGAVILWPLSLLVRLPPHGLLLAYAQDLATVGAGVVGFLWLCEMIERREDPLTMRPDWLAGLGLVLLVADPWIFLTPAFDLHIEAFGTCFVILAARAVQQGRIRHSLLWVALTLACGFVAATYVAGLAVGALLAGRRRERLYGLSLLAVAVVGVVALTGFKGSSWLAGTYAYLTPSLGSHATLPGILFQLLIHPGRAIQALWAERWHIFVNLAPAGLLGVIWRWGTGIVVIVLLSNTLQSVENLRTPSYQGLPIYVFVAVGTVIVLSGGSRRSRLAIPTDMARVLALIAATDTLVWGAVWLPNLPGNWLRVTPRAAHVLAGLDASIPSRGSVIASQGVIGRFSDRSYTNELTFGSTAAIPSSRPVWVILAPTEGIETTDPGVQQALVTQLAEEGHSQLVAHGSGIWAFRWFPPMGTAALSEPGSGAPIGGWVVAGPAGRPDLQGTPQQWAAVSQGTTGYVVNGDYFRRGTGTYRASVELSSAGPTVIEAWNTTGNALLRRIQLAPTSGSSLVAFDVPVAALYPRSEVYRGWGPFGYQPPFLPSGNDIELRVWQPGNSQVRVYSVSLSG